MRRLAGAVLALQLALAPAALAGCKKKASTGQCDAIVDRYAALRTAERMGDASADDQRTAQQRERAEAQGDETFKHCTTEVTEETFACAMSAKTSDAIEKCLE